MTDCSLDVVAPNQPLANWPSHRARRDLQMAWAFQGIITGLNGINNTMFVQVIDVGTDQMKSVAMTKIQEITSKP